MVIFYYPECLTLPAIHICLNHRQKKEIIMELKEFKQLLPKNRAILGFDYGSKRLGVAVSDLMLMIATSQKTIFRSNFATDLQAIEKVINDKEVGAIVYGLPLQMDGGEGATATEVRKFAAELDAKLHLPYTFWDERLSSRAMENFLIKEVDMSRSKRKEVLDSSSAAYILQGLLDALQRI